LNQFKKPQSEKKLGLVRTVLVFGIPLIVITEILIASNIFQFP